MLHAPDFLGAPDIISVARDHREAVERGLALKKAGNRLMELVGGRSINPINLRLGGFYSVPSRADMRAMGEVLRVALDDALATVAWVAGFDFPDLEIEHELLALTGDRYAIEDGVIARSAGPTFDVARFSDHVRETQVPHSTAMHATLDGRRHLTGPLARYSLNHRQLSPLAREAATAAGLGPQCRNPFRSIVVRAVEVVYAVEEALRIIDDYQVPGRPFVDVESRPAVGHGVSEAPRGLLYHRYEIDEAGLVKAAVIVPPTSQNQAAIEDDLVRVVMADGGLDDAALTAMCERTIRNYDPCISCATHFLTVRVTRRVRRSSSGSATSSAATTVSGPRWRRTWPPTPFPVFGHWSVRLNRPRSWTPGRGRRWRSWSTPPAALSRAGSGGARPTIWPTPRRSVPTIWVCGRPMSWDLSSAGFRGSWWSSPSMSPIPGTVWA